MLSFHLFLEVRTIACQHEDTRRKLESIASKIEDLYPSNVERQDLANVWEKINPKDEGELRKKGILLNFQGSEPGLLKFRLGIRVDVASYEDGVQCLDHIIRNVGDVFANVHLVGCKHTDIDTI